jgi:hypothetical protein
MRTLLIAVALSLAAAPAAAQQTAPPASAAADQARAFDWEFGTWRTHLRRLARPLSGSAEWVEYEGSSIVSPLLGGRANVVELAVAGLAGRVDGLSVRLFDPETQQWSLNYANLRNGTMTAPVTGAFADGRGVFTAEDTYDGRPILVRFVISDITPTSARFEQAFSADNGATWEVNWIAVDTRVE